MLLALLIVALAAYIITETRPYDSITRREMDALLKKGKEREQRALEEHSNRLKFVENDTCYVPLWQPEGRHTRRIMESEIDKTRAAWLTLLNDLHEKGQLDDEQFNTEVNRCLDS